MKKRNTTFNISRENFEKYPPAIFIKHLKFWVPSHWSIDESMLKRLQHFRFVQIFDKYFKTVIQNFFTVYVASTKHKGVYWRSCLKFSQTRECSTKLCKPRWGSLILKCRGGGGGGESKQYYLVREADPSVVFYLHFGACKVVSNYSLSRFLNMGGRGGQSVL